MICIIFLQVIMLRAYLMENIPTVVVSTIHPDNVVDCSYRHLLDRTVPKVTPHLDYFTWN
jgi:hypothetical protein